MSTTAKLPHILVITAILCALLLPFLAGAQSGARTSAPGNCGGANCLQDPLGGSQRDIPGFLSEVLRIIVRLGIPIAVLFIVWAGFKFVIAQGSEDKLKEAKKNLAYTLLGVAIFIAASLLVEIVSGTLRQFNL